MLQITEDYKPQVSSTIMKTVQKLSSDIKIETFSNGRHASVPSTTRPDSAISKQRAKVIISTHQGEFKVLQTKVHNMMEAVETEGS